MATTTPTPSAARPTPGTATRRATRRPAATADLFAALAARLTGRDRWILGMLAEHRVLTTTQIAALGFPHRRNAERRLAALWQWRCVDRFRPHTVFGAGSAPWHWVLDDAGAAVLTAAYGLPGPAGLAHRRGAALAVAHSQRLSHTVGTNTLLAGLARTGQLGCWWGERRCTAAWGDLARPDAAATWHTPTGAAAGYAVEYDTGTEPLTRVAAKLADYADLAAAVGQVLPVLFWLPTATRETALHRQFDPAALATTPHAPTWPHRARATTAGARAGGLLVATAAADHATTTGGPAGRVWRPADPGSGGPRARLTLDQLTAAWSRVSTLPVAAVDVGLGWPAPAPLPPDRARDGARPWGA